MASRPSFQLLIKSVTTTLTAQMGHEQTTVHAELPQLMSGVGQFLTVSSQSSQTKPNSTQCATQLKILKKPSEIPNKKTNKQLMQEKPRANNNPFQCFNSWVCFGFFRVLSSPLSNLNVILSIFQF